jgi:hypothetical protein
VFNGIRVDIPGVQIETGRWYALTLLYSGKSATAEYWLDGQLIATRIGDLNRPDTDGNVSNTHFGAGQAFGGYLRNLLVLSDRSVVSDVRETKKTKGYAIHPNPASSYLQIESSEEIGPWVIINLQGRICDAGEILDHNRVDISALPNGVFFFSTTGADGHHVTRFNKQD